MLPCPLLKLLFFKTRLSILQWLFFRSKGLFMRHIKMRYFISFLVVIFIEGFMHVMCKKGVNEDFLPKTSWWWWWWFGIFAFSPKGNHLSFVTDRKRNENYFVDYINCPGIHVTPEWGFANEKCLSPFFPDPFCFHAFWGLWICQNLCCAWISSHLRINIYIGLVSAIFYQQNCTKQIKPLLEVQTS